MSKYPKQPERFKRRSEELIERVSSPSTRIMFKIPPIAVLQYEMLLEAYHGGPVRAGLAFIRKGVAEAVRDARWSILLKITDSVGWTKLHHMPETETHHEYWHRHGRKCHGSPNCNDFNCIEKSLPRWFKWLTRWDHK
ncbi:MAG: hypothetical protein KGL39_02815 [Patescibacteria group bacterium]|nr:hypothetical protein [Patescibacteria group bacterium]